MTNWLTGADAASRFLQTVVIYDDFAYRDPTEEAVASAASLEGESLVGDVYDTSAGGPQEEEEPLTDAQDLETEVIVEGFADLGVNCAVLAPSASSKGDDERRINLVAARSDVVILDWVIRPPTGEAHEQPQSQTSLSVLVDILRNDIEAGGRLRLICVYSGKANVRDIVSVVEAELSREFNSLVVADELKIDFGAARIVFLSKARDVPTPGMKTINAEELPRTVLEEFRKFAASGLFPELALQSLSAVREQAHRLLRRFSADLDAALVSHRSVTSASHAVELSLALVGDELSAIVESEATSSVLDDGKVAAYVDSRLEGKEEAVYWKSVNGGPSRLQVDLARSALTVGLDSDNRIVDSDVRLDPKISRVPLLMFGSDEEVLTQSTAIDNQFSALSMLSRDSKFDGHDNKGPVLQIGALLKRISSPGSGDGDSDGLVLVCLQPLCDSVRLVGPTKFPMLPLREVHDGKFEYVVNSSGTYITLKAGSMRMRDLIMPSFLPSPEVKAIVAVWAGDGSGWLFSDNEGGQYVWLGNLRFAVAHKLLHSVAHTAGRIGINEYEYLRRAAGR